MDLIGCKLNVQELKCKEMDPIKFALKAEGRKEELTKSLRAKMQKLGNSRTKNAPSKMLGSICKGFRT